MRRYFWLLIGFFLLGNVAQATHFAGGDCYYDYVSATPGDNTRARYAVHYIFYRDIQGAAFNATSITVGMYDASPTSVSGVIEVLRTVPQYSRQFLTQYSQGCFYKSPIGYERVEFIDTVDLLRTKGYFFSTSNFARNGGQIQNISQAGPFSIVLSTYVPPRNSFVNNSPRFRAIPVPYACVGKKYVFNHDGFDPDGDSLVFNIVWPYGQGGTYRANGNVGEGGIPDFNVSTLPLAQRANFPSRPTLPGNNTGVSGYYTPVTYQGAYSFPSNQVPAIAPDTLKMTGNTGEISFTPTNQGGFVVAIECLEYRVDRINNVTTYLGSTRRDLQFFFDASCTGNTAPQVFVTDSFTLQVGDTLDFNAVGIDFDPTRDTVIMSISGDIVGTGSGKASVTITPGPSQAIMNVRWIPTCSFARTAPYFLIITAKDSICAVTQKTVYIRVLPKDIILPPSLRCAAVLGDDSISLSWVRTTSASADFGKYYIYRNLNGGAFALIDSIPSRTTQVYLDRNVSLADQSNVYGYFMVSVNNCGEPGLTSDTIFSILPLVQKISSTQFRVTWNELTTAIGKRYGKIYRLYEDRGPGFTLVQTGTQRSFVSSGCDFRIKYKVETTDSQTTCISSGFSIWNALKDTIRPSTPSITLFSVDGTGKSTITVQKSDSLDAIRYLIYRSSNGGAYVLIDSVNQTGLGTFVYRDASSNPSSIKYCYKVAARDSCGNLSFQSTENCGIKLTGIPGHFSSVLTWTPFSSPLLSGYVLQRWNGSLWVTIGSFPTTQLGYVDTPRACGIANTYRVFGTYGPSDSSFSNSVVVTPIDTIKPISPRLLSVSAISNDSVQVTFFRSPDPRVKLSRIQVSTNGGAFSNLTSFTNPTTDTLRFWHVGLNNAVNQYCYRVLAFDSCSNTISVPLDTHCVTQLSVTGGSRLNALTWPKYPFSLTDSVKVERLVGSTWMKWALLPGSATSFNDTGLVCNSTITYRVISFSSSLSAISVIRSGTVFDTTRPALAWINGISYLNDTLTLFFPTQFDVAGVNIYFKTNGGPQYLLRKYYKVNSSNFQKVALPTLTSSVDTFEFSITTFDSCSELESVQSPWYLPVHLRGTGGLYTSNLSFNAPVIPSNNSPSYSQVTLERFLSPLLGYQAVRTLTNIVPGFNSIIDTVPEYIINPTNINDTIDIFCGQGILYRISYQANVRTPAVVYSNEIETFPIDTFYPNNVNIIYLSTKGTDSIEVQWKKHIRPSVTKYVVYISQNGGPFVSVDTVLNNLPFVYFKRYGRYNMTNTQISVRIAAFDSCSGKWSKNYETHTHSFLTGTSLAGRKTAVLNWRTYRGYLPGFRYKIIRMDPANGVSSVIANVLDTFYTDTTMACNNPISYTIFIDEINGDGGSGYTNTITLIGTDTIAPNKPMISASVRGLNRIEIYPNTNFQDIDSFEVYGKTKFGTWSSLGFYKAQPVISVNFSPTMDSILCIRIVGLDSCANNRSVPSDEHCLIQLTGSPQNLSNQLNWSAYSGISTNNKIHIVQELISGVWQNIDTTLSNQLQYTHLNLPCGIEKTYRILYFDTISSVFSYSDSISLTPFDVTRPNKPSINIATVVDQNTIFIRWNASTSPDVNRYELWKSPLGTNNWVLDQLAFYRDSAWVTGNTVDTIWSFRLVAIDSCGNNRSDTSLVQTVANIQGIAQNLQLTLLLSNYRSTSQYSMTLEEFSPVNGWIGSTTKTGLTDTLVITNLPCNQPFTYRLMIQDSFGNTVSYSDSIQVVPFDTLIPDKPVIKYLSTNGVDSITVSWSASRSLNIKNYHIYGAPYGAPLAFLDSVPDTVLHYSFLANNVNSPWVIYVLAKNYCNEKLSLFEDSVVTYHPFLSQTGCDKSIQLDWSLGKFEFPIGNDSIGIYRGTSFNTLSLIQTLAPGTVNFVDTSVRFGTMYYYQIKVNSSNYRDYSLSFVANDSIVPLPIPGIILTSVLKTDPTNGSIEIKWNSVQTIPFSKSVNLYTSTTINGPKTLLGRFSRTDSFFVWNGINTETQSYYFFAYLEDSCGFVSESNAPHRDIDFSVNNAQLVNQMSWNHYEGVPVTSYQIEVLNGTTWNVFDVVNGNQNTYTRFPAPCNNQITYRLGAILANGRVSYSDTVTVRVIDNIVPDTALISQATVLNDSVVQLTFSMAGAADIYGYAIQQSINGGPATTVQFVPQGIIGTVVTIFDTVNTLINRLCYSVLTQDSCLNVSKGDAFCVIQLEGLAENLQNTLRWRPFAGYPIQTYEVAEWNGAAWNTIATQNGNDTDFVHAPLNCNQTRQYRIKGFSSNPAHFTFSDTLHLTPFDTVPPVAPTITGASVIANGSIQLDWSPVGGDVRSYEVWMKTSGVSTFTSMGVIGPITTFRATGLNTPDSSYCFYLIALDTCAANRSVPSTVHCVSQLQGVAQNLQNTLNWNVYSGVNPVKTKVQIFQGTWSDLDSLSGLASSYVHDSLPCRVPVTYRLKMEFPNGYLSYSDSITLTPFDTIPPTQPTILRASVLSSSSVQITWAQGNADIGNYEIWVKAANQANFTLAQTVGAVTTGIVSGLNTTDSSYCFRLVALDTCSNNRSPFSVDECAMQLQGVAQNLQTTLNWNAYSTVSGPVKYYVQRLQGGLWGNVDSTVNFTSYIHFNVPCLTPIHYRIMAVYPVADTSFSDTIVLVPFDTIKPLATLLNSASVQEDGSITVRWNTSSSPDVRFHDVYRAPIGSTAFVLVGTATDVDTFNDATVPNAGTQRYTYQVVAIDSCNLNNRSIESNLQTTFNLAVSSGACQPAVTLKWTPYTTFTNGLLRYRVWRSAGGPWTLVDSVSASDTDFIDYTVNPRFSYCYQVEAVSNGQTYLATSDTSCQVPRLYPNPNPTTMYGITTTVTGVANGQSKITWNRFPLNDSLARGYVVYHSTTGVWPYTPIATVSRPNDTVFFHNNINTADSIHYYTVKVIDTCGAQSDSAAPFRTINLNLTIGNGAMVLDWLPVLNDTVSGYEIERSSNGLPLVPITILSPTTTQYIDSAVSCGTRYSYRVKGLYSLKPNFTTFSDSVSGIARDTIPPDISVVEKATVSVPNRNGQIELSFYSPTQQNRSGYNIYRKTGNGAWSLLRTFNTTAFGLITTTDFGVNTLDSTYQYRLSSLDSCGNESQFGEIHSPSNISVTAVSQANNISWSAYLGFDSLIYRIERSINGGNFQFFYDLQGTSFVDSSIKCDTQYTYRVKVYDIQNPTVISLSDTATVIGIDLTAPATPVLGVVSVINTNPFGGTVQVNFANSTSTDVRYHILERRTANSANWSVRARIPAGGATIFNDFGNTSDSIYVYRIYAIDTCGNVSAFSAQHAFVHLETTPLNESMQLNWSRYVGFPVGKYDVVRDGNVIASFLGGNDTSMIDTQLICTQTYQYFIRTYGLDQLTTSLSNVENNSPFDTTAPLNTYLQVASVERGDASNKITFRASTSFDVRTYQIWRRTNGLGAPVVVYQTTNPVVGFTTVIDSLNVKADAESYCYSIVAFDYCGNQSPESNLGCTMLAKATYSKLKSTITWTPYSQWWAGVDHYEVERTTDGTNWIQVANVPTSVNKFIDEDLPADAGQLCYRVMAVETPGNFNEKSYSNTACVVPEPVVHIPTAFSPGTSAGLNDNFGPVAAFYDQFELTIFNRWGEKIFEGKSKNDRWDGKHKGELVQTGLYVYQLIVYDFNGKPYRFQGTLSVVR